MTIEDLLREENLQLKHRVERLESENAHLQAELRLSKEQAEAFRQSLSESISRETELSQSLSECNLTDLLRQENEDLKVKMQLLEVQNKDLKYKTDLLSEKTRRTQGELDRLKEEFDKMIVERSIDRDEMGSMSARIKELESINAHATKTNADIITGQIGHTVLSYMWHEILGISDPCPRTWDSMMVDLENEDKRLLGQEAKKIFSTATKPLAALSDAVKSACSSPDRRAVLHTNLTPEGTLVTADQAHAIASSRPAGLARKVVPLVEYLQKRPNHAGPFLRSDLDEQKKPRGS